MEERKNDGGDNEETISEAPSSKLVAFKSNKHSKNLFAFTSKKLYFPK